MLQVWLLIAGSTVLPLGLYGVIVDGYSGQLRRTLSPWLVLADDATLCDFNSLSPIDALKHQFTSLKIDLIFPQPRVSERKFP